MVYLLNYNLIKIDDEIEKSKIVRKIDLYI